MATSTAVEVSRHGPDVGVAAWAFGYRFPLTLQAPACAAAALFGLCWLAKPFQREGIWQLANGFDTLMQLALFTGLFQDLPGPWWWTLAIVVVGMYLLIAAVELTSACIGTRRWREPAQL